MSIASICCALVKNVQPLNAGVYVTFAASLCFYFIYGLTPVTFIGQSCVVAQIKMAYKRGNVLWMCSDRYCKW